MVNRLNDVEELSCKPTKRIYQIKLCVACVLCDEVKPKVFEDKAEWPGIWCPQSGGLEMSIVAKEG